MMKIVLSLIIVCFCCAAKPNVLLVTFDTTRRDHLGLYGYERNTSPNLDKLALESVTFDQLIPASCSTAPSHASILTSLNPIDHGITRNAIEVKKGVPSISRALQEHGYQTAAIISSGVLSKKVGLWTLFQTYDDRDMDRRRDRAQLPLAAAKEWLSTANPPWFLWVHIFDPHITYMPAREDLLKFVPEIRFSHRPKVRDSRRASPQERFEMIARYDAEILNADRALGELVDLVPQDTMVVLTSDHGEILYEHPWVMDHGSRPYEGVTRIPLVIRFPDRLGAGSRVYSPVQHMDIAPTILQALSLPPAKEFKGTSLVPLVRGEGYKAPPIYTLAIARPNRLPEVPSPVLNEGRIISLRYLGWKVISYPLAKGGFYSQLFQLPDEHRNRIKDYPELGQVMLHMITNWNDGVVQEHPKSATDPETIRNLQELGYIE